MENQTNTKLSHAGYNLSWGSVFAGVMTFFALLFTLSLIGSAIGFGLVDPTSNNGLDGVGTGVIIWTIISLVLSFIGAGFISGMTSRRLGVVHGFLTWASSTMALIIVLSYLTVGVFSAVGSLFGNMASATGAGIEKVTSGISDVVSESFDDAVKGMQEVDTSELEGNVEKVLKDTDVKELQPGYLENELSAATEDIKKASKEAVVNPDKLDKITADLNDKLEGRADKIDSAVDEQAIANSVAKNTDLSQSEAEKATKNLVNGLQEASDATKSEIENVREKLVEGQKELETKVKEAREEAEDASNKASVGSIWGFIAMVLGMVVSSYAGLLGANYVKDSVNEGKM